MGSANSENLRHEAAGGVRRQEWHRPPPELVLAHLKQILDSSAFRSSKRSQAFLSYVVHAALEGRSDTLKERTLAVELFGRPQDVDLADDTIVRVGAREVRRRLAQYYASEESANDAVHIDLPPGSYTPEFMTVAAKRTFTEGRQTADLRRVRLARGMGAAGVLAATALLLAYSGAFKPADAFWAPFLKAREPVLLAVAHPIVYHPSARANRLHAEHNPPAPSLLQQPVRVPSQLLDGSDWVPVFDQYVGYGDLVAAVGLSSYFASQGKSVRTRLASKLDFADLKEGPVILIGAYTNRWTMDLTKDLRFRFSRTSDGRPAIADGQQAGNGWALPVNREDGLTEEDFVLLARLIHSGTGKPLALVAGLKHFGTEAGAGFLTNPALRAEVLGRLPADWERRNLQVVLRARVYGNSPARPEVVRWHCW